jgi:putative PIN family toxin of toxin-antitoxin system
MKVVIDSNVLLVAIGKRSKHRLIWNTFVEGKYQLIISESIVHEYEEILKMYSAPGAAELVLETFIESPDIIFKRIYCSWNAILADPDDNKFFDVAVAANADYLVTNDAHFKEAELLVFPKVSIISADQFLTIVESLV